MLTMDDVKHPGNEARPALHETDWSSLQSLDREHLPHDFEELSPRSKGGVPKPSNEFSFRKGEPNPGSPNPNLMNAPPAAPSQREPRPSATGITPEFVSELVKLIREENKTMFREERQSIIQEAIQEYYKERQDDISGSVPSSTSGTKHSSPSQSPPQSSPTSQQAQPSVTDVLREASKGLETPMVPATAAYATAIPQSPTTSQASQSPRTSNVRFSDMGQHSPGATRDSASQYRRGSSNRSSVELSVVDQKWGVLFDDDNRPTPRLRQVLISLAEYIATSFLPQNSIVITPDKLVAFYSYHQLKEERYPFSVIFRTRTRDFNERLADLYQDLECQYHLIQTNTRSRPSIPCLTPIGFAQFMILNIQAYPDEEAKRLESIVSALPIDVESPLDGKPERLPKQLSRHLLPSKFSRRSRTLLDEAIKEFMEDLDIAIPTSPSSSQTRQQPVSSEKRPSDISPRSRYIPAANNSPTDPSRLAGGMDCSFTSGMPSNRRDSFRNERPHRMRPGDGPRPPTRDPYHMPPPPVGRNSFSRRDRSPQRRPFSQSVPANIGDSGIYGDQSSANSSIIFTPSSASNMSPTSELATLRGTDGEYRVHPPPMRDRPSPDDSTPRAGSAVNLRDALTRSISEKDTGSNRRSMVSQDSRGPTWDEVLRHQGRS